MRIMDIIFYFGVTTDLLILVKRDLKTLGGDFIPFSGADLGGGCYLVNSVLNKAH